MSNGFDIERPMTPLVKQLKHKFDQMAVNQISTRTARHHSQISPADIAKLHRVNINKYISKKCFYSSIRCRQPV